MIIGIDPHKMSHTANAVDPATNTTAASLRIDASLAGYRELMRWSKQFPERRWAVENALGLGRHLAQWLVARDEVVLDVPSSATARVRELSRGSRRTTDVIDAAAAASVAALHGDATIVTAEDHTTVRVARGTPREPCCTTSSGRQPAACGAARPDPGWRCTGDHRQVGGHVAAVSSSCVAGGTHPQGTRPGPRSRTPRRRCEPC